MIAITPRQIIYAGLLLGVIGAAMIAIGAAMFIRSPSSNHSITQRWWTLAGASLIGVGFAVQIAGQLAR
jgi:energy-converting hydrogenase Eha subunit G